MVYRKPKSRAARAFLRGASEITQPASASPILAPLPKIAFVLGATPNDLLGVRGEQPKSSAHLLQGRLAAAAAILPEADLQLLVVDAEATASFRAKA